VLLISLECFLCCIWVQSTSEALPSAMSVSYTIYGLKALLKRYGNWNVVKSKHRGALKVKSGVFLYSNCSISSVGP
jgi:hypothetical protein